jgi:hypothetical protein
LIASMLHSLKDETPDQNFHQLSDVNFGAAPGRHQ